METKQPKSETVKNLLTGFCVLLIVVFIFTTPEKSLEYNGLAPVFYNSAGLIQNVKPKIWDDYVTPSTATSNTIDISSAGFVGLRSVTITAEQNTTSVTNMPFVSIQSKSNTAIVVNVLTSNQQVISVLGATTTGLVAASNLSTMKLHVHVVGY